MPCLIGLTIKNKISMRIINNKSLVDLSGTNAVWKRDKSVRNIFNGTFQKQGHRDCCLHRMAELWEFNYNNVNISGNCLHCNLTICQSNRSEAVKYFCCQIDYFQRSSAKALWLWLHRLKSLMPMKEMYTLSAEIRWSVKLRIILVIMNRMKLCNCVMRL